ncbi:ribosome production factor 2 homolog [Folsomia candida]|uniref:ribosome production factor 2 homolog n=1 Tax=Folsomia candida TaxID=158441 RepID=UPI000B900090|nr:ribosome production factor 2 homolog [Folsomia candida]
MGVIQRVVKPSTRKGKRSLINRQPKLIENTKTSLFLRGNKASELSIKCAKDLCRIKKPHSVFFGKKKDFRPFEAVNEMETLCKKYDASLFSFVSHNKKRPHNLVLGRMFDNQVLDMVEFGIEKFKGLDDFKVPKFATGNKPCLLFSGEPWLSDTSDFFRIKNLLIDFFHGEEITNIRLEGIEHVYSFVAVENKIYLRGYKIALKKSGEKTPFVELEEMGPSADLVLRRVKLASADLFKSACKRPKELKPKKVKNISKDSFGSQLGQVHIPRQDLSKLTTRRMKGLKKSMADRKMEKAGRVRESNAEGEQTTATAPSTTVSSSSGAFVSTSRGPKSKLESVVSSGPAATKKGMQLHLSG